MVKKIALIAGVLLALGASIASAAGINLSWADCGLTGQLNNTFACNVNTGANIAFASFDPPANINEFLGIAAQIDVKTDQATLPDWWAYATGFCRAGALVVSPDFTTG